MLLLSNILKMNCNFDGISYMIYPHIGYGYGK